MQEFYYAKRPEKGLDKLLEHRFESLRCHEKNMYN